MFLTAFFAFLRCQRENGLLNTDKIEEIKPLQRQEKRFQALTSVLPKRVVIFILCAYLNVAYKSNVDGKTWAEYLEKLKDKEGNTPRFYDGVTDIRSVLRRGIDTKERWLSEWGKGDDNKPYTEDDYKRLDEIFSTMASRLDRSGGMDALQDMTLHNCAKRQLLADKMLAKGTKESVDIASKLSTMNQKDLEAEQLRGKDRVATEEITIPGVVEALKKKGVSAEMSMDDAVSYIMKVTHQKKYEMSLDAADHVIQLIINAMQKNNDEPEFEQLPRDLRFDTKFAGEFSEEPADWETEAYEYLGLSRREPGYFGNEETIGEKPPDVKNLDSRG